MSGARERVAAAVVVPAAANTWSKANRWEGPVCFGPSAETVTEVSSTVASRLGHCGGDRGAQPGPHTQAGREVAVWHLLNTMSALVVARNRGGRGPQVAK